MSANVEQRIRDLLADILRLPANEIGDNAELGITPGWDSANHINLVLTLEEEFGITLDASEIDSMLSFADVVATVEAKL
jgi:acyl carrier protein